MRTQVGLTPAQHGIWCGQQLVTDESAYLTAEYLELGPDVDLALLTSAIGLLHAESEALQAVIVERNGRVLMEVCSEIAPHVSCADLRAHGDDAAALAHATAQALSAPCTLDRGPLVRHHLLTLPSARRVWLLVAHHIVLDGYGVALCFARAAEHYRALCSGRTAPSRAGSLAALVVECDAYAAGEECARDRVFWERELAGLDEVPRLGRAQAGITRQVVRAESRLPDGTRERLDTAARAHGGSWADALVATTFALLRAETGAADLVLGLPVSARDTPLALRLPAMLMNIAPLRVQARTEESARDFLPAACAALVRVRPHARYRYEWLKREQRRLSRARPLYGPVLNILPFVRPVRIGEHAHVPVAVASGPLEAIGLTVRACPRGALALSVEGPREAASEARLGELCARFCELLAALHRPPSTHNERATALRAALITAPEPTPLPRLPLSALDAQAARVPAQVAVRQGVHALSYAELVRESSVLAKLLLQRGLGPGTIVAMALPRSVDAIVAIIAILRAGASYLPLDVDGPRERLAAIVADASPQLVLTDDAHAASLRSVCGPVPVRTPAELPEAVGRAELAAPSAADAAYVIYTSGSTGAPKGVVVCHGALGAFVAAASVRYGSFAAERVLSLASLAFDASVEEIFVTLADGGTLVLRDDGLLESIQALVAGVARDSITVLDLPTALFHALCAAMAAGQVELPRSVRLVIIGGEAVQPEHVRRFITEVGERTRLINSYGPTECTVVALSALLDGAGEPALGLPLPGVSALVLDPLGRPVAEGEEGELFLLGPTLARGYLRSADEQRLRFVELPVGRAYRTGDRVRLRQGALFFVGRSDDQHKLSGHRVELAEVERALLAQPGVREACAVVRREGGAALLVAYVVTDEGAPDDRGLRQRLGACLIDAAVPRLFLRVASLPRGATGKLDRRALAERALPSTQGGAPTDASSARLLRVLRAAAPGLHFGVDDDLFEAGLASLDALRAATALSAELGRDVPASLLFAQPSARALARALEEGELGDEERVRAAMLADCARAEELPPVRHHPRQRGALLVTGATGFVGAQLVTELLRVRTQRVVCLVRSPAGDAEARLHAALARHGLPPAELGRVEALSADLTLPDLGLGSSARTALAARVDCVFHCAAGVSLARAYPSLRGSNVLATQHLLAFACEAGARFQHVSTVAVAEVVEGGACERFAAMHPGLRDGYTQSKWVSECLVERAIARGLDASVVRLGRVTPASDGGAVNERDLMMMLLRASLATGLFPALSLREPWTPVDAVARALVALAQRDDAPRVVHLTPSDGVWLGDLPSALGSAGARVRPCTPEELAEALASRGDPEAQALRAFFAAQRPERAGPAARFGSPCAAQLFEDLGLTQAARETALLHGYLRSLGLPPAKRAADGAGEKP
jgi:nonribosomal peptide synthetase MxcG